MTGRPLVLLDTNVVSGLLDPGDALHADAGEAAEAWEARGAAAAQIRAGDLSVRVPDALILATAHESGATALLAADKKLAKISPGLVELMRPS